MTLFFSLLPLFIFGNIHCAGMCGPLVMILAKHPRRWWYFLGRALSFSFAGLVSSELGVMLFSLFAHYHVSSLCILLFGSVIILLGLLMLFKWRIPSNFWLFKKAAKISVALSCLMTHPSIWAVFLYGCCTLLLPCGQTIMVFSIIALEGTPLSGMINGFLFAVLTSPALIAAMHAWKAFPNNRKNHHLWIGASAIFAGFLAILRGCADFGLIPHFILNPHAETAFHLVIF
jgi:uncharacterized protein